jgi:formate--tetrahydrofolate ligase
MVALTSRLQHEFNYTDAQLAKRNVKRLDIDPRAVCQGWAMDFSAQALREIIIGLGSDMDGAAVLLVRDAIYDGVRSRV